MVHLLRRRAVLAGLSTTALMSAARAQDSGKLSFAMPDGAVDCHHHVYDARWSYIPDAINKPPPAPFREYRALQRRIGTTRNVVVQPSSYGMNHDCTLDALAQGGAQSRGVAVVGSAVTDAELKRLHQGGIRGTRIQFGLGDPVKIPEVEPLARRIAALGWHMQFNMNPDQYVEHEALLRRLPVPVMIDHLGRAPDVGHPSYAAVRRLLDGGNSWVKVSGAYLYGKAPGPDYPDTSAVAKGYIQAAPERCVWGSDWPHPDAVLGRTNAMGRKVAVPDDIAMLNLFAQWVPSAALRQRILVENPERFYGFDPKNRPKAGTAG